MKGQSVRVETDPPYCVHVSADGLQHVAEFAARYERCALLVDERVDALHGEHLAALGIESKLGLEPGEERKNFAELERVLDFMVAAKLDRSSLLLTFGGGVTSDLGGLAAALFKRGLDVVHLPTTLLAQVDASVGGKTAVNLKAGKNLAGSFHQPRAVFCDTSTLATLDPPELASGLGEVLKTALIEGEEALARLENLASELVACAPAAMAQVVHACVETKARIVAEDPQERGPRKVLNLGHTLGHGIESAAGYGAIPHGVAVATGINLAFELAARMGVLEDASLRERVRKLCESLGLPSTLAQLEASLGAKLESSSILQALAQDKKGRVGSPEFVLPERVGEFRLSVPVAEESLAELLAIR